jgi:hypothetical protein
MIPGNERIKSRAVDSIIAGLTRTAREWLRPGNPWCERAVAEAPAVTGFSPAMVQEAVALTFGPITESSLRSMLDRELGDRHVLDEFVAGKRAVGPRLIAHFLAGNVPPPGILSICCGLLLKSANVVRLSSRDPVFPRLFVESLRQSGAELADGVAVVEWPKEASGVTESLLKEADAVIAYGDDDTIATLRGLAPRHARFVGYGHKLSLAIVFKGSVTAEKLPALATAAAFDVSVYDQQGCLSPHVFYVEAGAREFAVALAEAMAAYQARVPRGVLTTGEASAFAQLRHATEFSGASDPSIAVWASPAANDWMVIFEENPVFRVSCLNRVVYVKPLASLDQLPGLLAPLAGKISTVGVSEWNDRLNALVELGVGRFCSIGQMQKPPLTWYHDGRPNVADLVRWIDQEL